MDQNSSRLLAIRILVTLRRWDTDRARNGVSLDAGAYIGIHRDRNQSSCKLKVCLLYWIYFISTFKNYNSVSPKTIKK